jgi:hypothetical protein
MKVLYRGMLPALVVASGTVPLTLLWGQLEPGRVKRGGESGVYMGVYMREKVQRRKCSSMDIKKLKLLFYFFLSGKVGASAFVF